MYKVTAVLFALLGVLLVSTRPAGADWTSTTITAGDGQGGVVSEPALRQEVSFSPSTIPFGLVQMDNGEIAMGVSVYVPSLGSTRPAITYSSNGGATWSPDEILPGTGAPLMLTYLGGSKLSYISSGDQTTYFSSDYGQTWPQSAVVPPTSNGQPFYVEGNAAVDRDASGNATRIMEIGWNIAPGLSYPPDPTNAYFRYSLDDGVTWQGTVEPPSWRFLDTYNGKSELMGVSEGSVVRAANGWLVADLRTDMLQQFQQFGNDNLDGNAISISKDNGKTWSSLDMLYDAGRNQGNLQLLPNGDLLLTVIDRDDILNGSSVLNSTDRGVDALISHDNGLTWNPVGGLITLDAFSYLNPQQWYDGEVGHLSSVVLSDGSVLTAYGDYVDGAAVLIKWNPTVVPEPATWLLLVAGGLTLLFARRRSANDPAPAGSRRGFVRLPGSYQVKIEAVPLMDAPADLKEKARNMRIPEKHNIGTTFAAEIGATEKQTTDFNLD